MKIVINVKTVMIVIYAKNVNIVLIVNNVIIVVIAVIKQIYVKKFLI